MSRTARQLPLSPLPLRIVELTDHVLAEAGHAETDGAKRGARWRLTKLPPGAEAESGWH